MFDVGFSELILLFVIGLLILGPERLPRVATQIGRWVGRARRTANQLRHQLEREIALNDIRRPTQNKPKDKAPSAPNNDDAPAGSSDVSEESSAARETGDSSAPDTSDGGDGQATSPDDKPSLPT